MFGRKRDDNGLEIITEKHYGRKEPFDAAEFLKRRGINKKKLSSLLSGISIGRSSSSDDDDKKSSSKTGPVGMVLGLGALACGAYKGYCDAQGIVIEKENLETMLIYGPIIANAALPGALGTVVGGLAGALHGAESCRYSDGVPTKAAKVGGGALIGSTLIGGILTAVGAAKGAVYLLIGYAGGYIVGSVAK